MRGYWNSNPGRNKVLFLSKTSRRVCGSPSRPFTGSSPSSSYVLPFIPNILITIYKNLCNPVSHQRRHDFNHMVVYCGGQIGNKIGFYPKSSVCTVNSHFTYGTYSYISHSGDVLVKGHRSTQTRFAPFPPSRQKMFTPQDERQGFKPEKITGKLY